MGRCNSHCSTSGISRDHQPRSIRFAAQPGRAAGGVPEPAAGEERARKRRELLDATEAELKRVQARVQRHKTPLRADALGFGASVIEENAQENAHPLQSAGRSSGR